MVRRHCVHNAAVITMKWVPLSQTPTDTHTMCCGICVRMKTLLQYIHTQSSLLGAPVQLVYAVIQSVNHMAWVQCVKSSQELHLMFRSNIGTGKTMLSVKCTMAWFLVPDRLVWGFQKLLNTRGFSTLQSLEFTQRDVKNKKCWVCDRSVGVSTLLITERSEVNGQIKSSCQERYTVISHIITPA